ncbi:DoxX family membrane protein [Saccharolobus solfataricus]|nr:thiosulfate:quinone oxidoreductase large subunit [Saccharolobus solfataricus]AKA75135.1 DoxX family membrane protein [Saccharolobus solfataricus]AKA77828.1 DoxX family membrane protein [Saccharolobus solfataricus]AKA80523.1 DoxX family membrane protein [Saccharolobus solfataricus]AZF69574.1 DoxX family membrane protein [Saccharolobus solfataricus]AZF72194.1 DoxX family membrane protein [Saccharolobus solfataricus]
MANKQVVDNLTRKEYLFPIRFAVGWMFFDGGIRKAILKPAKLDPNSSSFVGGKLVNFLPHAGPFKDFLLMTLENRTFDVTFLTIFSYVEILVGLFLIIGFLTRLSAFGAAVMAIGMAPAYWLGSTCEDEWQIGSLLTAGAIVLMLTAAGRVWGVDYYLYKKFGDWSLSKKIPLLNLIKFW